MRALDQQESIIKAMLRCDRRGKAWDQDDELLSSDTDEDMPAKLREEKRQRELLARIEKPPCDRKVLLPASVHLRMYRKAAFLLTFLQQCWPWITW